MQTFNKYINPLYKDINKVADFANVKPQDSLENEEYPHLEQVTKITKYKLDFLLLQLRRFEEELEEQAKRIELETGMDDKKDAKGVYNQILSKIEDIVFRINAELVVFDSPYFGKISFLPNDNSSNNPLILYIGKFAMIDKDTHIPLITDWRSPIANIYYQNSGPTNNVSFIAPVGERKGNLTQKRQFQITRARIKNIYDAKSGNAVADAFLLAQLQERIGKKLQDIVSTIQAQQNEIIRGKLNQPILIQGVAGSGKTTILLHRLAYLFYTYKEQIDSNNSLVIAPNKVFIDYVSDVLPNLGVSHVDTQTYLFWGKKVLGWDKYYILSNEPENLEYKEYKGSVEFIEVLDRYLESVEERILDNIPYYGKDIIAKRYCELKDEFSDIEMVERLELATEYAFAQNEYKRLQNTPFVDDNHADTKSSILRYFRNSCNIFSLYKNFYKSDFVKKDISKYSLAGLSAEGRIHHYRVEDLAPMVYLALCMNGVKQFERDYVMVDEAQDVSYVQLATLLKIAKGGDITIAGDLAQSIIPPFYIKDWNCVLDLIKRFTNKDAEYVQLQRCYRTTVEIIEFANKIFADKFPKSYMLPEAVLRHGDEVSILRLEGCIKDSNENEITELVDIIKKQFSKGAVTCALLCKDTKHADDLYEIFKNYEQEIGRRVVSYMENDYQSGLLILPIESAKGLEFDSVILADVSSAYYSDSFYDIKLLYVGITRALHRVFIVTKKNDSLLELLLNNFN